MTDKTQTPSRDDAATEPDQTIETAQGVDTDPPAERSAATGSAKPETETGSSEAAKWRRRLRDTEAERDALKGHAEAAQRTLINYLAEKAGRIAPDALWASGVTLEQLLDDAGDVDPARVEAAVEKAATRFRLTRRMKPDPSQGPHGGIQGYDETFESAFAPRNR